MPIPQPKPDESKSEFISRCMGNETMAKEYPDDKQRAAVCFSSWRKGGRIQNIEDFKDAFMDKDA